MGDFLHPAFNGIAGLIDSAHLPFSTNTSIIYVTRIAYGLMLHFLLTGQYNE